MMNTIASALPISISLSILALLSACGGSSTPDAPAAAAPAALPAAAPTARFGDCFQLAPGARYLMSDGSSRLNVLENFNGKPETGSTLIAPGGMRLITVYQSFDGNVVRFAGDVEFNAEGDTAQSSVNAEAASLPGNLQPGATYQVDSVETVTEYRNPGSPDSQPVTETKTVSQPIHFLGFEDLTLGGQLFRDACKLSIPDEEDQTATQFWYAKGYGLIRQIENPQPNGTANSNSIELAQVLVPAK
jgi:hypothetical protein